MPKKKTVIPAEQPADALSAETGGDESAGLPPEAPYGEGIGDGIAVPGETLPPGAPDDVPAGEIPPADAPAGTPGEDGFPADGDSPFPAVEGTAGEPLTVRERRVMIPSTGRCFRSWARPATLSPARRSR